MLFLRNLFIILVFTGCGAPQFVHYMNNEYERIPSTQQGDDSLSCEEIRNLQFEVAKKTELVSDNLTSADFVSVMTAPIGLYIIDSKKSDFKEMGIRRIKVLENLFQEKKCLSQK